MSALQLVLPDWKGNDGNDGCVVECEDSSALGVGRTNEHGARRVGLVLLNSNLIPSGDALNLRWLLL